MISSNSYAVAMQRGNLIRQSEEIIPSAIDVGTITSNAILNNKSTNNESYKIHSKRRNDDDLGVLRRYADVQDPFLGKDLPVFWHLPKVRTALHQSNINDVETFFFSFLFLYSSSLLITLYTFLVLNFRPEGVA
jgi:hypothetical protein